MEMTAKSQEFEYTHGISPGLRPGDVLIAWVAAVLLVIALTAAV